MSPRLYFLCWFAAAVVVLPVRAQEPPLLEDLPPHPRLLFTAADQARIEAQLPDDPLLQALVARLRVEADGVLPEPPVEYKLVGPRLLGQSRLALARVLTLSLAYRLFDEDRYRDRAVAELRAAAAFPDWNPSHFLDVAEMTTAFALGYDWLYEALSAEERAFIEQAIREHGLRPGLERYENDVWWREQNPNNWNQVCNAGLLLGALATAEQDPALARAITAHARASIPYGMAAYAPEGQYIEGPTYWNYGTTYNALLIAALGSALDTDWDLLDMPGFRETGAFRIHTLSPTRRYFNYADAGLHGSPSPTLMWLGQAVDQPDYVAYHRAWLAERMADLEAGRTSSLPGGRFFPLEIVWYATAPDALDLPRDALFESHGDVVTLRSAWDDPDALFVGFKGGKNNASHAHLDIGSFVLEADGVRWAVDLGGDNYNLPDYWNMRDGGTRWTYFRLNNRSHNTLVVDDSLQPPGAQATAVAFTSTPQRAHAVMDLTGAYARVAEQAYRGVALLDRSRVLVQDELVLHDPGSTIRWGMVTEAQVELDGGTALLRQDGKRLRAEILAPAGARFETLSTDPGDPRQRSNEGTRMLATVVAPNAEGKVRLAVLLTPVGERWPASPAPDLQPLGTWANEALSIGAVQAPASESGWPEGFREVAIPTVDGGVQMAYYRPSSRSTPQPLVVVLHTWSGDYRQQSNSLADQVTARDWHYIHPGFRGPNRHPEACCSDLVIADIDAAIDYAIAQGSVDPERIYVTGASGGGYATLCYFMKGVHTAASYAAWVPISDLEAWHAETAARGLRYAEEVRQCTGSGSTLDVAEARRRSPLHMATPTDRLRETRLRLFAGIRDGYDGSVPITHSLLFYNKVLTDLGVSAPASIISDDDIRRLLTLTVPQGVQGQIGGRAVLYDRRHETLRVTIFDGDHEMLDAVALDVLAE